MVYVIDFDDVLFDKSGAFSRACAKIGIDFRGPLYQKSKQNGIYNPKKHLKLLNKPYSVLEGIIKQGKEFLLPGVKRKLKELGKDNHLILLSKGNLEFKKAKIKHSGVEKFFERVYLTEESKLAVFEKEIIPNYPHQKIVFIDDKKEELAAIKEHYPGIKTQSSL